MLIPALEGRDIIARAKTGTGKTLAFGIPIIKRLSEDDDGNRKSRYLFTYFLNFISFLIVCLRNTQTIALLIFNVLFAAP